jgi:hypothetical protein
VVASIRLDDRQHARVEAGGSLAGDERPDDSLETAESGGGEHVKNGERRAVDGERSGACIGVSRGGVEYSSRRAPGNMGRRRDPGHRSD